MAIVSPYSMSRPGGVQEHTRGLARELVRLGHDVSLFGPELRGKQPDLDGVHTVSLGGAVGIPANGSVAPLGIDPRMLVRFDLTLDPADVIHVHEPFLPACLGAVIRRPGRTAVVGTFHAAAGRGFWPYAVTAPLLRRFARKLDETTAVSPAARELVRRYVPLDPEIVPNGVDVASFDVESDPWASALGGTVVLFVGRAEPRKGVDVVSRAFAQLTASHPSAHLVCAGVEPHELPPDVSPERIHCIGWVDSRRRNALHRAASIVVCPSLAGESFGLTVLEGLAGGSAVLASDIPGYRYSGGGAAAYVPPGDVEAWRNALARLLDDTNERELYARTGPERARSFDWSRIAERTVEIYERAQNVKN